MSYRSEPRSNLPLILRESLCVEQLTGSIGIGKNVLLDSLLNLNAPFHFRQELARALQLQLCLQPPVLEPLQPREEERGDIEGEERFVGFVEEDEKVARFDYFVQRCRVERRDELSWSGGGGRRRRRVEMRVHDKPHLPESLSPSTVMFGSLPPLAHADGQSGRSPPSSPSRTSPSRARRSSSGSSLRPLCALLTPAASTSTSPLTVPKSPTTRCAPPPPPPLPPG